MAGCQVDPLLDVLRRTESDDFRLVRDVVVGWPLGCRGDWHRKRNDVIRKLRRKARRGTTVVGVPGNHAERRAISSTSTSTSAASRCAAAGQRNAATAGTD